jgi:hypothetical protein
MNQFFKSHVHYDWSIAIPTALGSAINAFVTYITNPPDQFWSISQIGLTYTPLYSSTVVLEYSENEFLR